MATITSVANGYWDQTGTWDLGVPTINDDVIVKTEHIVTIRDENAVCLSLTIQPSGPGGTLYFDCADGPTKITFKDDANAKLVNNGTISIVNTSETRKCTWAGGSSANKVDWQTEGLLYQAHHWHLEYIKISFNKTITNIKIYVDKDVQTDSFSVEGGAALTIAAGVTWVVGHAGEDGVDRLQLIDSEIVCLATSSNKITIKGTGPTERMAEFYLVRAIIEMEYVDVLYAKITWINGDISVTESRGRMKNVTANSNNQYGTWYRGQGEMLFKDCKFWSSAGEGFAIGSSHAIVEGGDFKGTTYAIRLTSGAMLDIRGSPNLNGQGIIWQSPNYPARINYYKKLSLTVTDVEANPIASAYIALIQDHVEDYGEKIQDFVDGGYTNAAGQVELWALWKTLNEHQENIYYSDENNNGPSGAKEKYLLKVVKENYWPSQDRSYYMSQDRSDTIVLTPYLEAVSYPAPELYLRNLIYVNYGISDPPKDQVEMPEVIDRAFLRNIHVVGKNMIWVTREEEPHRPATFAHKRVDLNCIVHIYVRARNSTNAEVKAAQTRENNMITEVAEIIKTNGPVSPILDFHPNLRHFINRDDDNADPPIYAHDLHIRCVFLR